MNKHGQTLVLFVILIPVILILLAVVVDLGFVLGKKIEISEITRTAIKDCYDKNDESIKEYLIKNNIDVDNLKIIRESDSLILENKTQVKSIFGSIIGTLKYDVKIKIKGYKDNNKIIFE